ncbi:MAG: hypothetical protein ACR65T_10705 [Methylocystis sp.]|uniref:hypothetical protein n=1 Tax=Methylocystis sp. TaxID=1911079 RepID=UPI003DA3A798
MDAVDVELGAMRRAREQRRQEKDVAMLLWATSQFGQVFLQFVVVARRNGRESFRAHKAFHFAHNVESQRGMRPWRKTKAARVGVENEQLLGGGDCDEERPRLIDLFNQIERAMAQGMKPDRLEFHLAKEAERVSDLAEEPLLRIVSRHPNLFNQSVSVGDRMHGQVIDSLGHRASIHRIKDPAKSGTWL